MLRSYTSTKVGLAPRIREALNLYRVHSQNVPGQVHQLLRRLRGIENDIRQYAGKELKGLDVLEIGPGQMSKYLRLRVVEDDNPNTRSELVRLKQAGELGDYSEEELLTREVVAVWKRPS